MTLLASGSKNGAASRLVLLLCNSRYVVAIAHSEIACE